MAAIAAADTAQAPLVLAGLSAKPARPDRPVAPVRHVRAAIATSIQVRIAVRQRVGATAVARIAVVASARRRRVARDRAPAARAYRVAT